MSDNLDLIIALSRVKVYATITDFPSTGNLKKIYMDKAQNRLYHWNGTMYIPLTGAPLSYGGLYNPITNVPTLSSGSATSSGVFYIVSHSNNNITPPIDGITQLEIGDWVLSQEDPNNAGSYIWTRLEYQQAELPPVSINSNQTLSNLNAPHLVTANSDITLTIPQATVNNQTKFFRIIKVAGTGTITVTPDTGVNFLGEENDIKMRDIGDVITLQSTGSSVQGWATIQKSLQKILIDDVEILGDTNNDIEQDGNWLVDVVGDLLIFYRRESGSWVERFSAGSSLITDRYILDSSAGTVVFTNSTNQTRTLLKPSIDDNGSVVGNPNGRVAFISNDEPLFVDIDDSSEQTDNIQTVTDEVQIGTSFTYSFVSSRVQALRSGLASFSNTPANTNARISILSSSDVLLAESETEFDFNEGRGISISNGVNTLSLREELAISSGFNFKIKIETTNSVDIQGTTTDLGDGLGSRFVPYAVLKYYNGQEFNVTHDGNIVSQLEAKTGTDKLDPTALKTKINTISANTTVSSTNVADYRDSEVICTNSSSNIILTLSEDIFTVGDTLYVKQFGGNDETVTITQQGTGASIDGSASKTIGNGQSVKLLYVSENNWRIMAGYDLNDDDNYVDGASFTGDTLTLTRTGTLPDLTAEMPNATISADGSMSSEDKIELDRVAEMMQEDVLDRNLSTPPASPNTGDRYIVGSTPTGDWAGQANNIAEYNGTSWDFVTPSNGMLTFVDDEDVLYFWEGADWRPIPSDFYNSTSLISSGDIGNPNGNFAILTSNASTITLSNSSTAPHTWTMTAIQNARTTDATYSITRTGITFFPGFGTSHTIPAGETHLFLNSNTNVIEMSKWVEFGSHSVTELRDVTNAGSGQIITTTERTNLENSYSSIDFNSSTRVLTMTENDGETDTVTLTAGGMDSDAIHDNLAGEINAITEKTTPVGTDLLLIEDSADSNNKKKIQVSTVTTNVVDNLTSTSSTDALSANQGRLLDIKIDNSLPALFSYEATVGDPTNDDNVDLGDPATFPSLTSEDGTSLTNNASYDATNDRIIITPISASQRGVIDFDQPSPGTGKVFTSRFEIEPHNGNIAGIADGLGFYANCSAPPTTNDVTNSDSIYKNHEGIMIFIDTHNEEFELHFGNELKANQIVHTVAWSTFTPAFTKAYFADGNTHVLHGFILDKRVVAYVDDIKIIDYQLGIKDIPMGGNKFGFMARTGASFAGHYVDYLSIGNISSEEIDYDRGFRKQQLDTIQDIVIQDEGTSLATGMQTMNFVGAGVTASGTGATKTITISGGSGAGGMYENVTAYSTSQTITSGTQGVIRYTGSSDATFTLPTLTASDEWAAFISNDSTNGTVTVSGSFPSGVNGVFLSPQQGQTIYWDGANFREGAVRDFITTGAFPDHPSNTLTRGKTWSNDGQSGTIDSTGINLRGATDIEWLGMKNTNLRFFLSGGSFIIDLQEWAIANIGEGVTISNQASSNIHILVRPYSSETIIDGATTYTFASGIRVNPGASATVIKSSNNNQWRVSAKSGNVAGGSEGGAGGNSGSGTDLENVSQITEFDNLYELANNGTGATIQYGRPVLLNVEDSMKGMTPASSRDYIDGLCGTDLVDNERGRMLIRGEIVDYEYDIWGNGARPHVYPITSGTKLYYDFTNNRYTTNSDDGRFLSTITTSAYRLPNSAQSFTGSLNINSESLINTYLNKTTVGTTSSAKDVTLPLIGEGNPLNSLITDGDLFAFAMEYNNGFIDIQTVSGNTLYDVSGIPITNNIYRITSASEGEGISVYRWNDGWRLNALNAGLLVNTFKFHVTEHLLEELKIADFRTVYVSNRGYDTNNGTINNPVSTITQAELLASAITGTAKKVIACLDSSSFTESLSTMESNTIYYFPYADTTGTLNTTGHSEFVKFRKTGALIVGVNSEVEVETVDGNITFENGTHARTKLTVHDQLTNTPTRTFTFNGTGQIYVDIAEIEATPSSITIPSNLTVRGRIEDRTFIGYNDVNPPKVNEVITTNTTISDLNKDYVLSPANASLVITLDTVANFGIGDNQTGEFWITNDSSSYYVQVSTTSGSFRGTSTGTFFLYPNECRKFHVVDDGTNSFIEPIGEIVYRFHVASNSAYTNLMTPVFVNEPTFVQIPSGVSDISNTTRLNIKIPCRLELFTESEFYWYGTTTTVDVLLNPSGNQAIYDGQISNPSILVNKNGSLNQSAKGSTLPKINAFTANNSHRFNAIDVSNTTDYIEFGVANVVTSNSRVNSTDVDVIITVKEK